MREESLEILDRQIREKGVEAETLEWYRDLRRYGSVPHAGFGLGLERTLAWICGLHHLREAFPFPRLMGRLHPLFAQSPVEKSRLWGSYRIDLGSRVSTLRPASGTPARRVPSGPPLPRIPLLRISINWGQTREFSTKSREHTPVSGAH